MLRALGCASDVLRGVLNEISDDLNCAVLKIPGLLAGCKIEPDPLRTIRGLAAGAVGTDRASRIFKLPALHQAEHRNPYPHRVQAHLIRHGY